MPEEQWVAELVREQLLAVTRDELPYSIATRVTEWEWPRIRCDIIVERESQKGMVIGKGGSVLKEVGELRQGAAAAGRLPRAARQGRQGLAAPPRSRRATRVLRRRGGSTRCASGWVDARCRRRFGDGRRGGASSWWSCPGRRSSRICEVLERDRLAVLGEHVVGRERRPERTTVTGEQHLADALEAA